MSPVDRAPVVIPVLNEAAHIQNVIRSLEDRDAPGGGYTFYVVDGGSSDGTVEVALDLTREGIDVRIVRNFAMIQSAGVNLAVAQLPPDCEAFVRCDAHADYPPHFVRTLLDTMAAQNADSVVTTMNSIGVTCLQNAIAWLSNTPVGTGGSNHRGGAKSGWIDHGHHAAFRTKAFRAVGGYNSELVANEDAELDARLRQSGAKIWLEASVPIKYFPRRTLAALARQYYRYGSGRASTSLLHPASMRARQVAVPGNLLAMLACISLVPITLWTLMWPLAYLAALVLTSVAMMIVKRSVCGIWCGPAAFVMHTAWGLGFLGRISTAPLDGFATPTVRRATLPLGDLASLGGVWAPAEARSAGRLSRAAL